MKRITISGIIFLALTMGFLSLPAQSPAHDTSQDRAELLPGTPSPASIVIPLNEIGTYSSGSILYDNGPIITNPGAGSGGADASVLQGNLSMSTYGIGAQITEGWWLAEDFQVPPGGWDVEGFGFFAYQTGSGTTPTMDDVRILIYDGDPGSSSSSVIFGDASVNRFTSASFTNIYRVTNTSLSNTDRPIMLLHCEISLNLPEGDYWIAWQIGGNSSFAGPWVPPISITGQTTTGDGLQSNNNLVSWFNAVDTGTSTNQGLPFIVYGPNGDDPPLPAVPLRHWALWLAILMIAAFLALRLRKAVSFTR